MFHWSRSCPSCLHAVNQSEIRIILINQSESSIYLQCSHILDCSITTGDPGMLLQSLNNQSEISIMFEQPIRDEYYVWREDYLQNLLASLQVVRITSSFVQEICWLHKLWSQKVLAPVNLEILNFNKNIWHIKNTWKSAVTASGRKLCLCMIWYKTSCCSMAGFRSPINTWTNQRSVV